MVMRQAASLLVVGLGVGTVLGMFGARVVRTMLFGVEPHDPWILAGAAGLLAASALVASYLPARRASRVDPLEALRQE
jgi:ABC-type antimicrobial peptide transport system permease subunit